jgi:flagellar hook-length control protein FliK
MAAEVSVTTTSASDTTATRVSESAALRDSPMGAATANGFSSAMSAAARAPGSPDNGGETSATSPNAAHGANLRAGDEQAPSAAATVAEADASTIDANMATADGKTPEKTSGKARPGGTDASSPTDPATLAMLLAASGMPIDGRAGAGLPTTGQPGSASNSTAGDDRSREVAAAGTLGANLALAALTSPAAMSQANAPNSNVAASGSGKTATSALLSAVSTDKSTQTILDSLVTGSAHGEQDAADSPLLQNKSAAGDTLLAQPGSASAPNGLPEMIRGLTPAPMQTAGVERTIALPVTDRNWSEGLAAQVHWQINNNVQSATLQLSPEHLGPLEVRIDLQPSQVNVSFTASHPDTRSALEQSVPRLREILAHSGLTLGQASVQQEARPGSQYSPSVSRSPIGGSQSVDPVSVSPVRTLGLIDEYA